MSFVQNKQKDSNHTNPILYSRKFTPKVSLNRETIVKGAAAKIHLRMFFDEFDKVFKRVARGGRCEVDITEEELNKKREDIINKVNRDLLKEQNKLYTFVYTKIKVLGTGGNSIVYLVHDMQTNNYNALKVISKQHLLSTDTIINVKKERDILKNFNSPRFVRLERAFQDRKNVYFLLEFMQGGDLRRLMSQRGRFTEKEACFYIGEIVLAIEKLNERDYCHLDLKPDNIMLTADGHVKLSDFGSSTKINPSARERKEYVRYENVLTEISDIVAGKVDDPDEYVYKKVTTLLYTPPEVLCLNKYFLNTDSWHLGCILYEMIYGIHPFYSNNAELVVYKIVRWNECLMLPYDQSASRECASLILSLITDYSERLHVKDIKNHPFFRVNGYDFENPEKNKPPIIPELIKVDGEKDPNLHDDTINERVTFTELDVCEYAFLDWTYRRTITNH